jgi:hypothetical protein
MGSVLEMSKLVTASWLYRNWKTCPLLLKSYLTSAVVVLMVITSMGIFGFLSQAHIDSTLEAGANSVEIKTLKQQEKIANERLEYLLKRAGNPETASANVDRQIQQTQKELADINKRKLPLLKEENKLVAEVGPIKYIGDMIYGTDDTNAIDKAVRLVIMLIMVVFDPLAVLLLIAANMSMANRGGKPIIKDGEVVGLTPSDIPVFTDKVKSEEKSSDKVEIAKENITKIEQPAEESIVIDGASGESIPPISKSKRGFPVRKTKTEDISKYDEKSELAFKEKRLDGGDF